MRQLSDKQKQAIINTLNNGYEAQQEMIDAFKRMLGVTACVNLNNELTRYMQRRNKRDVSDRCNGLYVCWVNLGLGQPAVDRAERIERFVNKHLGNKECFCDPSEIDVA